MKKIDITTVSGRKELYELALADYTSEDKWGDYALSNGFCMYFNDEHDLWCYADMDTYLPELAAQEPEDHSIIGWFDEPGPIDERVNALKEAIKLCDEALFKSQPLLNL